MANPTRRSPSTSRRPAPASGTRQPRWVIPAVALILVFLVWVIRPSPYSKVANLGSRGTSVIAFGDSLTAGYGAGPGEDYPSRLAARIGVPIINAGVSGDTTEAALARLDADVLARDPRIVIIGLGGNDFLRGIPISSSEANLRTIVRKVEGSGAIAVVLGFTFPSIISSYDKMYQRVAKEEKALLIPKVLKGILNDQSLKSDEIHPNGKGYALMAERIAGPCRKLIAKADARR